VHQLDNIAIAIQLAESLRDRGFRIPPAAIVSGIENAKHAGRLEFWPGRPTLLFDGAHNVAGAEALRSYLDSFVTKPITLVFGAMADKNLEKMAAILFPVAKRLVLTQQANPRTATIGTLEKLAAQTNFHSATSASEAIQIAQKITSDDELICITGSLYLVGDIQAAIMKSKQASLI
jgi:dihydrofolate synthase/folylpolyglutamate synthase